MRTIGWVLVLVTFFGWTAFSQGHPRVTIKECEPHEFRCNRGPCIGIERKCDLIKDCDDYSDETGCDPKPKLNIKISPENKELTEDEDTDATIVCRDVGPLRVDVEWSRSDGRPIRGSITRNRQASRLFITKLVASDEGSYICKGPKVLQEVASGSFSEIYLRVNRKQTEVKPVFPESRTLPHPEPGRTASTPLRAEDVFEATSIRPACSSDQFPCNDGSCIDKSLLCDKDVNCADGSDERNCWGCDPKISFLCHSDQMCIPLKDQCDGHFDCSDNSDEKSCPGPCPERYSRCTTGECIHSNKLCDGNKDCPDSSDEKRCPQSRQYRGVTSKPCLPHQFQCKSGQCIDNRWRCDNRNDCKDSSDERGCGPKISLNIKIYPQTKEFVENEEKGAAIGCRDEGHLRVDVEWSRSDGRPIRGSITGNRKAPILILKNLVPSDEGTYMCSGLQVLQGKVSIKSFSEIYLRVIRKQRGVESGIPKARKRPDVDPNRSALISGIVEEVFGGTISRPVKLDCDPMKYFTCHSDNMCIPLKYQCDGQFDCYDKSDETSCPGPCPERYSRCKTGNCLLYTKFCDGYLDCSDGSDEKRCDEKELTAKIRPHEVTFDPCQLFQFRCLSDSSCIANSKRCDKRMDCKDFSDELRCDDKIQVKVLIYPNENKAAKGADIVIRCRDVGPLGVPVVFSRSDEKPIRGSIVIIQGVTHLQILKLDISDQGLYSCSVKSTFLPNVTGSPASITFVQVLGKEVEANAAAPEAKIRPDLEPRLSPSACSSDQFPCNDGSCVDQSLACDDDINCADGSDERNCLYTDSNEVDDCLPTDPFCKIDKEKDVETESLKQSVGVTDECVDRGPLQEALQWPAMKVKGRLIYCPMLSRYNLVNVRDGFIYAFEQE